MFRLMLNLAVCGSGILFVVVFAAILKVGTGYGRPFELAILNELWFWERCIVLIVVSGFGLAILASFLNFRVQNWRWFALTISLAFTYGGLACHTLF